MIWPQVDFCCGDIYVTLSLQEKKFVGFYAPEIMKQCWDFAAGTYGFWDPINFELDVPDAWFSPKQ